MGHVWGVSRPAIHGRRSSCSLCAAATALLGLWAATAAAQQKSDAEARLRQLNVRLETDHYVLAGTVNDRVVEQCGQQLEAIYREYAALFRQVLQDEKANSSHPGESLPGGKGGAASHGAPPKGSPADSDAKSSGQRDTSKSPSASQPTAKPASKGATQRGKSAAPAKAGKPHEAAAGGTAAQTIDQDDPRGRFRVLIFASQGEYDDFTKEFHLGTPGSTRGLYVPSLRLLLIADQGNPDETGGVLFHEACHQFVGRYLKNAPVWLNEGLASYFGSARLSRGQLRSEPDRDRWQLCRRAITADRALSLKDIFAATYEQFHEAVPVKLSGYRRLERDRLYYAQSYTLIHLLLSRPEGRERLCDCIRALARTPARSGLEITAMHFGPDVIAALERNWKEYILAHPENE